MSLLCHETRIGVHNPFYFVSAVLKDKENKRAAFSNLELCLSKETAKRISLNSLSTSIDEIEENIFYAIEMASGTEGGSSGNVQLSYGNIKTGEYKYAPRYLIISNFPNVAKDLLNKPDWIELIDGNYRKAEWAEEFYKKLISK